MQGVLGQSKDENMALLASVENMICKQAQPGHFGSPARNPWFQGNPCAKLQSVCALPGPDNIPATDTGSMEMQLASTPCADKDQAKIRDAPERQNVTMSRMSTLGDCYTNKGCCTATVSRLLPVVLRSGSNCNLTAGYCQSMHLFRLK